MSGQSTNGSKPPSFALYGRGNEPDSDPEPPMAPPVIILSASNCLGCRKNQGPGSSDANLGAEPQPHTSPSAPSISSETKHWRYNLRRKNIEKKEREPEPDPQSEPAPDSAPPIIFLPTLKRSASSSQLRLVSPSASNSSPQTRPRKTPRKMGSKASKLSSKVQGEHSKLQPAVANSDKEQMKEPANYYSHRSKSMRRKAGRGGEGGSSAAP